MRVLWIILCMIVLYILLLLGSSLLVDKGKEYSTDSPYYRWLLNSATCIMMFLLRIRVRTSGNEKIPKGRFLLVSNHRSNFDPILTWYIFRKQNISFISKEENFKIPIFGRIIHRCCFMAIDRKDPRNALVTINKAAELITEDIVSIGIYPEGTRSKECVLLPFHAGVFKIAQKAQVPVVVMTIAGTEKIHRNIPFRKTCVDIDVIEVIPPEALQKTRTAFISDSVKARMEENLRTKNKEKEV